jgi:hypothetical protein
VAGANIRIEGQRLGAITDENGHYQVVGIPGGEYTVHVDMMGSAPFTATKVSIAPDFTTELIVTLKTPGDSAGRDQGRGDRPLLQKDATGTTRFLSGDDIQKMPTRGYRDAAAQQTGVVNFKRGAYTGILADPEASNSNTLIIRGGRPNETAYFVDGFSQQDPLTGNFNHRDQQQRDPGGGGDDRRFAPEYGRIMSGAVNVVTREGGGHYSGALEAVTDALGGQLGAVAEDRLQHLRRLAGLARSFRATTVRPSTSPASALAARSHARVHSRCDRRPEYQALGLSTDYKPNNSSGGYTYQGKVNLDLGKGATLKLGRPGLRGQLARIHAQPT